MTNGTDADFLQVLLGEVREDPLVDLVVAECRLKLAHSDKLFAAFDFRQAHGKEPRNAGLFLRIRIEHAGTPRGPRGGRMRKRPTLPSMNWARDPYCAELLTLIIIAALVFGAGRGPAPRSAGSVDCLLFHSGDDRLWQSERRACATNRDSHVR
jgi:hypothetical protein